MERSQGQVRKVGRKVRVWPSVQEGIALLVEIVDMAEQKCRI